MFLDTQCNHSNHISLHGSFLLRLQRLCYCGYCICILYENLQNYFMRKLVKVIIHPMYDRVYNDLALVRLVEPIDFDGSDLMPICIPPNSKFNDSVEKGVVAGWGSIRDPHCTTDGKGPDKFHRCRFPFKYKSDESGAASQYDSCTFAPPPGHKETNFIKI
jgi:hypothetical protein